jgi:preprotein translocase subunit SecF
MLNLFQNIHIDWLGKRKAFIGVSIFIMLAGLISAVGRQYTPGGTEAFNLGVDFRGGTVVTAKFRQRPTDDEIRGALNAAGVSDPVIQASTDKPDEVLIKIPLIESQASGEAVSEQVQQEQVQSGRMIVKARSRHFWKGSRRRLDARYGTRFCVQDRGN